MTKLTIYHFYPERIVWVGLALLGGAFLLACPFLYHLFLPSASSQYSSSTSVKEKPVGPYEFSLGLRQTAPVIPIPDFIGKMTFSFDPPRPDGINRGKRLVVRMEHSLDSQRITLPCRLDLEFQGDKLCFSKEKSPLWIELSLAENGQIEGRGFVESSEGHKIEAGSFSSKGQECPLQAASEFPEGSPFRLLADAKWWGRDLFREADSGERIEVRAGDLVELKAGDWLVWKEQKWQKGNSPEKELPIAHIQDSPGKQLILEGWDSNGYIRLGLHFQGGIPFKIRGEELFSAIRIRSEKQISCMLEKQCLVLRTGDWVLKTNGRWKILRKGQEKEAFLNGKLSGELLIFEQISQRQGQKMIHAKLFNPTRTQVVAIEMAAQSTRKAEDKGMRRAKL